MDRTREVIARLLSARDHALATEHCPQPPIGCGRPLAEIPFRDEVSVREAKISGLCQECQDTIFQL